MREIFKFLLFIFILFLGFSSGMFIRFFWLLTYQRSLMFDILDKPLKEAKGGGSTPQETWLIYLDALEKEDIDRALEQVWPSERERFMKLFTKLKENDLLTRYAKNKSRKIDLDEEPFRMIEEDERFYWYENINEKDIELLLVGEESRKASEEYWAEKGVNKEKIHSFVIFKYNPHTKKWLIKI